MAFMSIAYEFILWRLYLVFNWIFTFFRNLIWRLTGTHRAVLESKKPKNYDKSAHVMNIWFSHRFDAYIETFISDFGLVHERFESPEFVLRDDVNLMQITEDEVIFVQKKEGSKPFEEFPFVITGVHDAPIKVITMPHYSYIKLTESMGDVNKLDAKICFLQNTGRCGGTLFTEMFKASGKTITNCEPHVFNAISKFYLNEEIWSKEFTKTMLKSTVTYICKPRSDLAEKPVSYVIKPTVFFLPMAGILQEVIPNVVQFFVYRDPVKTAISVRRLMEALPTLGMMTVLPKFPGCAAYWVSVWGYCDVLYRNWAPKSPLEIIWGFRLSAAHMKKYLDWNKEGVKIHGIRYEITLDNQQTITEQIFDLAGIPRSAVSKAIDAVGRDSQRDSPVSQAILKRLNPNPPIAGPEFLAEAQQMCKDLGLPGIEEFSDNSFALPDTIVP